MRRLQPGLLRHHAVHGDDGTGDIVEATRRPPANGRTPGLCIGAGDATCSRIRYHITHVLTYVHDFAIFLYAGTTVF